MSDDARDLLPIQSLLRSIDFDASSLPPFLLVLPLTNGSTGSSFQVSNTVPKEENKMVVSHDLWPQQSLARDHVQHTALYLCALSAENDPFSTF